MGMNNLEIRYRGNGETPPLHSIKLRELEKERSEFVDPDILLVLELCITEYPQAGDTVFETFTPEDEFDAGGFYRLIEEGDEIIPTIFISEGHHERMESLLKIRRASVEAAAHLLEIAPDHMTTRLLRQFIITHELGHILDFLNNYLPEHTNSIDAADEMSQHRELSMRTLPVSGVNPTDLAREISSLTSLQQAFTLFPSLSKYPRRDEILSLADLLRIQEEEYRSTPQERYADEFAAQFLKRHAKELQNVFLDQSIQPDKKAV
ncbi:hypothetical protein EPN81_01045 [Patescibacteria group bacterium]|nr:MAG: hypothetical protein EPN81_01045 [Patescibacteria group bacterium]